MPIEQVDTEGEIGFLEGLFLQVEPVCGKGTGAHHDPVQIGRAAGHSRNMGAEDAHLTFRYLCWRGVPISAVSFSALLDLVSREQLRLDQFHVFVRVEQVGLLTASANTDAVPRILWVVCVEENQADAEHLA